MVGSLAFGLFIESQRSRNGAAVLRAVLLNSEPLGVAGLYTTCVRYRYNLCVECVLLWQSRLEQRGLRRCRSLCIIFEIFYARLELHKAISYPDFAGKTRNLPPVCRPRARRSCVAPLAAWSAASVRPAEWSMQFPRASPGVRPFASSNV